MRLLKSHPILRLANSFLVDSPQPINLSYLWNFGSLLAICLVIQIITGVTLAMHYNPSVAEAFNSVEHIMRDVNNGWLIRYLHSNTASAFFFLVYLHIGRGMYYGSYRAPRTLVWTIGTVIFILMMATAFLGYELSPKWPINLNSNYLSTFGFMPLISYRNSSVKNYSSSSEKEKKTFLDLFLEKYNINPIYVFENLGLDETRNNINKTLNNLSGVYLIFNNTTGDYYIGSASTNRFYARYCNHLIHFTGSKVIKNAVRKYKINNFSFLVLDLFPEIVDKENNKKLLDLEDFYLKWLLPNYNILTEAGNSFGYKHTELSRIKMVTNYSKERREMIGSLTKGKTLSEETIEKIRQAALNKSKIEYSEQALSNMKKKSKPIILYNLDRTVFGEYSSIVETAKSINCDQKTIIRALKTESKILKRRYIVAYK